MNNAVRALNGYAPRRKPSEAKKALRAFTSDILHKAHVLQSLVAGGAFSAQARPALMDFAKLYGPFEWIVSSSCEHGACLSPAFLDNFIPRLWRDFDTRYRAAMKHRNFGMIRIYISRFIVAPFMYMARLANSMRVVEALGSPSFQLIFLLVSSASWGGPIFQMYQKSGILDMLIHFVYFLVETKPLVVINLLFNNETAREFVLKPFTKLYMRRLASYGRNASEFAIFLAGAAAEMSPSKVAKAVVGQSGRRFGQHIDSTYAAYHTHIASQISKAAPYVQKVANKIKQVANSTIGSANTGPAISVLLSALTSTDLGNRFVSGHLADVGMYNSMRALVNKDTVLDAVLGVRTNRATNYHMFRNFTSLFLSPENQDDWIAWYMRPHRLKVTGNIKIENGKCLAEVIDYGDRGLPSKVFVGLEHVTTEAEYPKVAAACNAATSSSINKVLSKKTLLCAGLCMVITSIVVTSYMLMNAPDESSDQLWSNYTKAKREAVGGDEWDEIHALAAQVASADTALAKREADKALLQAHTKLNSNSSNKNNVENSHDVENAIRNMAKKFNNTSNEVGAEYAQRRDIMLKFIAGVSEVSSAQTSNDRERAVIKQLKQQNTVKPPPPQPLIKGPPPNANEKKKPAPPKKKPAAAPKRKPPVVVEPH